MKSVMQIELSKILLGDIIADFFPYLVSGVVMKLKGKSINLD